MNTNTEVEKYLSGWAMQAKAAYKQGDPDFIINLKLGIDSFVSQLNPEPPLPILSELVSQIENYLSEPESLYDFLGIDQPTQLTPGSSPILGYTLIKPIGSGGYGEVWTASAPGEIIVAMKFLPRDNPISRIQSQIEISALNAIKNINHVNLVPISALWENANPVYIVYQMALSDYSLAEYTVHHPQKSKEGISAPELLPLFHSTAQALDYLTFPPDKQRPSLVHCDIKPANIFVTGDNIRVGDFGSVRLLDSSGRSTPGPGSTPFMPPEWFEGYVTPWSDQYSLAISWYYLRTGKIPFDIKSISDPASDMTMKTSISAELASLPPDSAPCQYRQAHLYATPNLSLLPKREQKILAKALAKDPKQRYTSSSKFVQALEKRRHFFPWVFLTILIALVLGLYQHYVSVKKQIAQNALNASAAQQQKKAEAEQKEFQAVARKTAMNLVHHMATLDSFVRMANEYQGRWDKFHQKYLENPSMRSAILDDFTEMVNHNLPVIINKAKEPITLPIERDLQILQKHNISVADIQAFYSDAYPASRDFFCASMTGLASNAKNYASNDKKSILLTNKMTCNSNAVLKLMIESIYCGVLEVIDNFPPKIRQDVLEQYKSTDPTIGKDIPFNWTAKQYADKGAELGKQANEVYASLTTEVEQEEDETFELERKVDQIKQAEQRVEEKQQKVDALKKELAEKQARLKELKEKQKNSESAQP